LIWQGNGSTSILPRQIHQRECPLEVQLIGAALTYLRDKVNTHLQDGETDSGQPLVVFIEGDKIDPLSIQSGRVNILVVNVEEERELRGANPYYDERSQRINPNIPLSISVLFIARFNDYPTSWNYLTDIIRFFQSHPVLQRADTQSQSSNNMPEGIESLRCEMISLNFQQQNEVWGALRITQHPALLYKIKLITLRDQQPQSSVVTKNVIVKLMDKEKAEAIDTMINSNTT
jgi:hypothetical protein